MSLYQAIIIITLALLIGCSEKQNENISKQTEIPQDLREIVFEQDEVIISKTPASTELDIEDAQIIKALVALDENELKQSAQIFHELWKTTQKPEYLKQSLGIALELSRFELLSQDEIHALLADMEHYLKADPTSQDVRRTLIALLTANKDIERARYEAEELVKLEENEENYELLGSILFVNGDLQGAQTAFRKSYHFGESALILERLISVVPIKQAIPLLETHIRFKGCEERLCLILGDIYKKEKQFDRAEEVYAKLYKQDANQDNLQLYLNILLINKHYTKAIELLEENPNQDKMLLLDLYREQKQPQKAMELARILFEETKEMRFITIEALLEYENLKQPITQKELLNPIVDKLKKVADSGEADDLIYNFLGYLLIDHQVNVEAGIGYVQKALEQQPDTPAYLDSLGWGYYYLNDCQKAREIFEKIPEQERDKEPEIKEHYERVKNCKPQQNEQKAQQ
ncbi:MAG: hypothetical protein K2N12_00575 [Helicobacter sp.]|nr:hypothetical protein [Helicobacter sp.]